MEAGAPEHSIRAQGTICYEFMLMRDPGEVHKTTLDEFKGAWMYKGVEQASGKVPGYLGVSAAKTNQIP